MSGLNGPVDKSYSIGFHTLSPPQLCLVLDNEAAGGATRTPSGIMGAALGIVGVGGGGTMAADAPPSSSAAAVVGPGGASASPTADRWSVVDTIRGCLEAVAADQVWGLMILTVKQHI